MDGHDVPIARDPKINYMYPHPRAHDPTEQYNQHQVWMVVISSALFLI